MSLELKIKSTLIRSMAFVALAVPAFLGGLVTGLVRPPIPLRRGKRDQKQFSLWPELANVHFSTRLT